MDYNEHALRFLVRERLADMRRQAARRALVPRRARRPLRARLGLALIALGRVLAGPCVTVRQEPTHG